MSDDKSYTYRDAGERFKVICRLSDETKGITFDTPGSLNARIGEYCRMATDGKIEDGFVWLKLYLGYKSTIELIDLEKRGGKWYDVIQSIKKCWPFWEYSYYQEHPNTNRSISKEQKKLRLTVSGLINAYLKRRKSTKNGKKTKQIIERGLNYTFKELKEHIEKQFKPGMTWENHGSVWHIDHKTPDSWFEYKSTDDEGFKKSWSLDNLQPLDKDLNMMKGNKFAN